MTMVPVLARPLGGTLGASLGGVRSAGPRSLANGASDNTWACDQLLGAVCVGPNGGRYREECRETNIAGNPRAFEAVWTPTRSG
jgi:hypothetical protein